MNKSRFRTFVSACVMTLAASLPSVAGAVELQDLPSLKPTEGMMINFPLTGVASATGVITSMRSSYSVGGEVLYGELTGAAAGEFTVWVGSDEVESVVGLQSAPSGTILSLPAGGYYSDNMKFGKVDVSVETLLASDSACDLDVFDPTGFSKAQKSAVVGVPEDQGGVAFPSNHTFYDLLDYDAGSNPVPVLNSYPFTGNQNHGNTPRAVIYLDFNGGDVTRGGDNYSTPAFVRPTDAQFILSNSDVIAIEDAFQVVAERLRPFNINVTTDLSAFLAAPKHSRAWAFFTADYDGGRATLTGFGTDTPAIIGLRNAINDRKPGMIASHEIGHLLSVAHFGPGTAGNLGYYEGHHAFPGSTAHWWNTPMGFAFQNIYKVYQWTRGEYSGATYGGDATDPGSLIIPPAYRDSLAKIDAELGVQLGYRVDDRPNSQAAAKTLVADAEFKGIIERNTDVDVFKFDTSATGDIELLVLSLADHPALEQIDGHTGRSMAALDVLAQLFNSSGSLVATSNPVDSLDALIHVPNAPAGRYYLHLSGTGVGTPTSSSPTGYTSYGSIGSYSVSATYRTNPFAKPDLRVTSFTYGTSNTTENGPWWWEITPVATVKNFGNAPAAGAMVKTHLQFNGGSPEPLDVVLNYHDVLDPGAQATVSMYFPIDLTPLAAGDYRLGAKADADHQVSESNEFNNLLIGADVATVTPLAPVTPATPRIPPYAPGEMVTVTAGQPVTLEAVTTDPQGDAITYHWDFDDDGIADATSGPTASGQPSSVVHTFQASNKPRYVRVRAEADANGEPRITPWCYLPSNSLVVVVEP